MKVRTLLPEPGQLQADLKRLARENPDMAGTLENAVTTIATLHAKLATAIAVLDDVEFVRS